MVDAEALELAADDVGAVARRRLEHAERGAVDADDGERAGGVRALDDRRGVGLERAEEARVLEVDAATSSPSSRIERREVDRRRWPDRTAISSTVMRLPHVPVMIERRSGREQRRHERAAPARSAGRP